MTFYFNDLFILFNFDFVMKLNIKSLITENQLNIFLKKKMPILDPGLQFAFSDTRSIDHTNYGKRFFLYYLKIASRNIFQNIQTIEAAEQFKTDVQNSISYLNNEFGCHLAEEDFEGNQLIFNYYKYLFDNISDEIKEKYMKKVKGEYRIFSNNMKFFVPYVDFSESHCWHLTDSPIAILGVNPSNIGKKNTIKGGL